MNTPRMINPQPPPVPRVKKLFALRAARADGSLIRLGNIDIFMGVEPENLEALDGLEASNHPLYLAKDRLKQEKTMFEYDNRQYLLMLNQIRDFESNRIDLQHLIGGLDALLSALEEAETNWKSEFQRQWGVLEQVYAVALDRKKELMAEDWKLIETAIQTMKRLLAQVYTEEEGQDA